MIIDTNDPKIIDELEDKKDRLNEKILEKGYYDASDVALVRTSNYLEEDHTLKPLSKIPFVLKRNNVPYNVMYNIIREKYNVNVFNQDENYNKFKEIVDAYSPYSSQYRSTIHFSLNGLVASHSKGNFDNRNFIIIDKLNKHLGNEDFKSIRMEDSFVSGNFQISDDAIILIDENKYNDLINKYPCLNTYNVVKFKGDEKLATEYVLVNMGIMPEKIKTHSSEYSERTSLYEDYFISLEEKYGIGNDKHIYSEEYTNDDEKNIILWQIYDNKFYNDLFNHFRLEQDNFKEILNNLLSYEINNYDKENILKEVIQYIGLENYENFVIEYNKNIIKNINNNNYPTNEEIIENNEIIFKDSYQNNKTL